MSTVASGYIEVVNRTVNPTFTNTNNYDFIVYTDTSNQSIHLGCGSNVSSTLQVTKSNIQVFGDISLTGNLLKGGQVFQPGGGSAAGLSNTTTAVYVQSGSNFGVGTNNPQSLLHVAGNARIDGDIAMLNKSLRFSSLALQAPVSSSGPANITNTVTTIPGINTANPAEVKFSLSNAQNRYTFGNSVGTTLMTINNTGLNVEGDIDFKGTLKYMGTPFQSGVPGLSNTQTSVFVKTGSNLGVGTSTPQSLLHVAGNAQVDRAVSMSRIIITQRVV